ncbi:MAG: glycosyltransferase [Elusimicrobiota bacterium]
MSAAETPLPRSPADLARRAELIGFFDSRAPERDRWKRKNHYYHEAVTKIVCGLVRPGLKVLELGCGAGDLLAAVKPSRGVGLDFSSKMIEAARARHPELEFVEGDAEDLPLTETFDVVILSDLVGSLGDVWRVFRELKKVCRADTRIILTYYNYLWEPILQLGEKIGLKMPCPLQSWLPLPDLVNMLELAGFESVKEGRNLLFPLHVPGLSTLINRFVAPLPFIDRLGLLTSLVARPQPAPREYSVSVVVPTRDEADNIAPLVERLPLFPGGTELIFVDGASKDATVARIEEAIARGREGLSIRLLHQPQPKGKSEAVHIGFREAKNDILMILDADVTVQPEDLVKFYLMLAEGRGEFVNGSRLTYPMRENAMRFLNLLGNRFFSGALSWLLGQRVRDTLCGTKVFFRRHYADIMAVRDTIGQIDPFGDFELLFGASYRNLRIVELPVRYHERTYGVTKISRFRHGFQLLYLCGVVMLRLKLPFAQKPAEE